MLNQLGFIICMLLSCAAWATAGFMYCQSRHGRDDFKPPAAQPDPTPPGAEIDLDAIDEEWKAMQRRAVELKTKEHVTTHAIVQGSSTALLQARAAAGRRLG